MTNRYLFWFCQENPSFRLAEVQALLALFNCRVKLCDTPKEKPFLIVDTDLENEDKLKRVSARSVCIRSLYHLWAHGTSQDELINQLKACDSTKRPEYAGKDRSFRIMVETYGKKISIQRKVEKIEELAFLPFQGPINLVSPDNSFHLIEYYGRHLQGPPEKPYDIFFGTWLADGNRKIASDTCLKNRKFISNTSMTPRLAATMANLAMVKESDLVIDPFVGSGSLLVAAAQFGAYTLGCDIDFLLLHGKRKPTRMNVSQRDPDESVLANFRQYGLQSRYLDVIVADASKPLWRESMEIDAIITDPPYGIRETSRKVGTTKYDESYKIPEQYLECHIPSKVLYRLEDIMNDLFGFALTNLKIGGRLVFWIPKIQGNDTLESLPQHPAFKLISYCNQDMKFNVARVLVCYERQSATSAGKLFIPDVIKNFRDIYLAGLRSEKVEKMKQNGG